MTRKLLSLLVAVAFILTTVSTAFAAAVPSDVAGTDYVKAVGKMQSLGIMVGDPSGNFRPNDTIKRSEFAKIAVIAMGMGDAAAISAGTTQFSDVPADSWASGYINVASGAGIIKGYAGKFNPDATLTYAEAVTIIARMLGYAPVLDSKPWPQAYVAKAAEIGITDGVTMATTVGAKRGDVAKLVNNALTIEPLVVAEYDVSGKASYKVSTLEGDTILVKNLKCSLIEDEQVVKLTPGWDNNIDSKITFTNGNTYEFVSTINADDYIGLKVKAWKATQGTNKDKLVAVEVVTDTDDIYDGKVEKDDNQFKLVGLNKSVDDATTSGGVCVSILNKTTNDSAILGTIDGYTATGRVVLENGKVARAYLNFAGDVDGADNGVVKEISDGFIKFQGGTMPDLKIQDKKDDAAKKNIRYDVIKDGKAATIDDIKAGDVVTFIDFGTYEKYIVTTGTDVGGVVASITNSAREDATINIGSKSYSLGKFSYYTADNGDTYTDAEANISTTFKDFVGKTIKAYLNDAGEIAMITATSSSATYYYGLFNKFIQDVGTASGLVDYAEIYKPDGTKVDLIFDDSTNVTSATTCSGRNVAVGDIVQYQLTSDGKIKDDSLYTGATITLDNMTFDTVDTDSNPASDTPNSIGTKLVSDTTDIMNAAPLTGADGVELGDANVLTFTSIKGQHLGDASIIYDNTGVVRFIALNSGSALSAPDGVVTAWGVDADGATVTVNEAGTSKVYKSTATTSAAKGYFATYSVGSNGKVTYISAVSTFNATSTGQLYRITGISGNYIKVKRLDANKMEKGTEYTFSVDDPDIYNVVDKDNIKGGLKMSDLAKYDYIWIDSTSSTVNVTKIVKMNVDDITVVTAVP